MTTILIIAALIVLAFMWWLFASAPEGFEDSDGFHYGRKSDDLDSEG